ncbi:TadE family type IV pilus minor pilin [Actinokineospora sp.]|uniref:TadE family type IV pilus minor pilin n=1 Tax=Actinokineospora sp. TaxID=1872133 RepID=UPI0040375EFB
MGPPSTAPPSTTPACASDRGAVTVEAAIALCGLTLVLALAIGGLSAVVDQIRCVDAAREAARLVARGEPDRAHVVAGEIAPRGAEIRIRRTGDTVSVEVSAVPVGGLLPGVRLRADAHAVAEPGAVAEGGDQQ